MILCFLVISIFVVVKQHVARSKCIFLLFLVFVRHFLVHLSELFWTEFIKAVIFIMLLPFCFAALNLPIYIPAIYLLICLSEVICRSFLKAVLSTETVPFINRNSTIYQICLLWNSDSYKDLPRIYWLL